MALTQQLQLWLIRKLGLNLDSDSEEQADPLCTSHLGPHEDEERGGLGGGLCISWEGREQQLINPPSLQLSQAGPAG